MKTYKKTTLMLSLLLSIPVCAQAPIAGPSAPVSSFIASATMNLKSLFNKTASGISQSGIWQRGKQLTGIGCSYISTGLSVLGAKTKRAATYVQPAAQATLAFASRQSLTTKLAATAVFTTGLGYAAWKLYKTLTHQTPEQIMITTAQQIARNDIAQLEALHALAIKTEADLKKRAFRAHFVYLEESKKIQFMVTTDVELPEKQKHLIKKFIDLRSQAHRMIMGTHTTGETAEQPSLQAFTDLITQLKLLVAMFEKQN